MRLANVCGVMVCGITSLTLGICLPASAQPSASSSAERAAGSALDFAFFKDRVQPILVAKRPGHARCVACHTTGTPMRLQPLSPGSAAWNDDDSRKNFAVVQREVLPGSLQSKLLVHPLAREAGGDIFHNGGKHWTSQNDPEWQTLAAWVKGEKAAAASGNVRIIQTNSAGDNIEIIDPVANKIVGEITGIEANHGVAAAPDGRSIYVSNEADSTLDVADAKSFQVTKKIALSGHPNNIAISRDGRRVYVAIAQAPGAVDVIDTASLTKAKSIAVKGSVHNTYVTPDGRFVVSGSIPSKTITVIDAKTEEPVWALEMDRGIRPMAFAANADGSTKWIFAQLSGFNGFAVVDFATRSEVKRITLPALGPGRSPFMVGGNESHGMAVTPDGKTLVVNSRLNGALYSYSLPDLTLLGSADVGLSPDWVTVTPDGKRAYVANAASNSVSVVDISSMKEVTRIPVGQVPKRNITALLQ